MDKYTVQNFLLRFKFNWSIIRDRP